MTNQQINLFQPIFRKQRKVLSFVAMLQACMVIVAALAAISGYSWWQNQALKTELVKVKQQHDQRLAQLELIIRESKKLQSKDKTKNEIELLEQELNAERHILTVLDGKRLRHIKGFSNYFESFSRQIIRGMWLTGFDVAQGGQSIQIRGSSIEPELVPLFLKRLSDETPLNGTEFSVFQMLREEIDLQWVDFILSAGEFHKQEMS